MPVNTGLDNGAAPVTSAYPKDTFPVLLLTLRTGLLSATNRVVAIQVFDVPDGAVVDVGIPSSAGLTLVAYGTKFAAGMVAMALATNAVVASVLSPPETL